MRQPPDMSQEARSMMENGREVLRETGMVPLHAFVCLTPEAKERLGIKDDMICLDLRVTTDLPDAKLTEKRNNLNKTVEFIRKNAECVIFRGLGAGIFPELGSDEIKYLFIHVGIRGFKAWTILQPYQQVGEDIVFLDEIESTKNNIGFYAIPPLWPEEIN